MWNTTSHRENTYLFTQLDQIELKPDMKSIVRLSLLIILPLLLASNRMDTSPTALDIAEKMFKQTKQIRSMSYYMTKQERIEGKMEEQKSFAKIECKPYKVYTKQLAPKKGLEVLYLEGTNKGLATINPNGFPWVNLNLDPYGSIMRKKQHHTLLDAGYAHVVSILEFLFNKYASEITDMSSLDSEVWNGKDCWKLSFNNLHFTQQTIKFEQQETVSSWAIKKKLSEYMILENNSQLKSYDDNLFGKLVKLPNDYSPKMVLLIDKTRMIPMLMEVYDDQGLYERYEYTDVKINPTFGQEEFTTDYEDYRF